MVRRDQTSPLIPIPANFYIHVMDLNTHVIRLVKGPRSYVRQQNEEVHTGPTPMIKLTTKQYCIISNPVILSDSGQPVLDELGQVKLRMGDEEYRFHQEPFPLYPGEVVVTKSEELPIVAANSALRLQSLETFDDDGTERIAGEEWLFEGPAIYYPRKEVKVVKTEKSHEIHRNSALCLTATRDCVDRQGNRRVHGEKWLIRTPGLYLPGPYEKVVETRYARNVSKTCALRMRAKVTHTDDFGIQHRIGDEWLITSEKSDSHICSVDEEIVESVSITVLSKHEYCVILDPVDAEGVRQLGKSKLVRGEMSFFLQPGETLRNGVEKSYILKFNEGLVLCAEDEFEDEVSVSGSTEKRKVVRKSGDQWLIRGPLEYVPPITVSVKCQRTLIPLSMNEGIYVQNTSTGAVRAVVGEAYMLDQDEELWSKEVSPDLIPLLLENNEVSAAADSESRTFDPTRVITYRVPHNAVLQVYDYKDKKSRIEFGPTLVMLGPDEQFTKLNLSGGFPKRPNVIKRLCLLLGPDYCRDVITVDTADHARLSISLSFNWQFHLKKPYTQEDGAKLFTIPDFIGDATKFIASLVRGAIASVKFDDFYKDSVRIIQKAIFGTDDKGQLKDKLVFPQNNLHITNVDVRSVEPMDQRTKDALQKSVQLAIEIATNSQEAAARRETERMEQEARASLKARTMGVETDAELERLKKIRAATLDYLNEKTNLKLKARTEEINLDVSRFKTMIDAIGPDTIKAIATASSENNLQMLSALGLHSTLITDGTTPVNLLSTAHGLIGQLANTDTYNRSPPKKPRLAQTIRQSGTATSDAGLESVSELHVGDGDDDDDLSATGDS